MTHRIEFLPVHFTAVPQHDADEVGSPWRLLICGFHQQGILWKREQTIMCMLPVSHMRPHLAFTDWQTNAVTCCHTCPLQAMANQWLYAATSGLHTVANQCSVLWSRIQQVHHQFSSCLVNPQNTQWWTENSKFDSELGRSVVNQQLPPSHYHPHTPLYPCWSVSCYC